jgi:RNA polymerase sigma-70 factor (ECF subfamily)
VLARLRGENEGFTPALLFPCLWPTCMTTASQSTDGTLIAAVLAGDSEAFAVLVERYQGPLRRLAESRLGNRDWAQDVVQETFLCAFKSLRGYDSRFSFRTWLWTILLNQCARHYQKRQRQAAILAGAVRDCPQHSLQPLAGGEPSPQETLLAKEQAEVLTQVLAALPDEQADALRLRFFGELKFQEIADVQGCSLTTAKNRVRFGLLQMAGRLRPTGEPADSKASFAAHRSPLTTEADV